MIPDIERKDYQAPQPADTSAPLQNLSKSSWWMIVVGIVGLSLLIILAAFIYQRVSSPYTPVLHAYMKHMAAKDAKGAYEYFAPTAREHVPFARIEGLLEGRSFSTFDGYQSLKVTSSEVSHNPGGIPEVVASVSGTIHYAGGYESMFRAALAQAEQGWMLYTMNIQVPAQPVK